MVQTSHEEGKRMIDVNCDCHFMIDEVSVSTNTNGTSVKCGLSVLGSTAPGQVGKTMTEFFKCDGKASGMFLNLAEACCLITREQRLAAQQQGVGLNIDEMLLKGRQFGATVRMEPNMRKNPVTGQNEVDPEKPGPFPRIGFNTFSIWDQKAAKIPLDRQMAAMMPRPAHLANQPAPPQAAQSQPTATSAAPAQQQLPLTGPGQSAVSMNW